MVHLKIVLNKNVTLHYLKEGNDPSRDGVVLIYHSGELQQEMSKLKTAIELKRTVDHFSGISYAVVTMNNPNLGRDLRKPHFQHCIVSLQKPVRLSFRELDITAVPHELVLMENVSRHKVEIRPGHDNQVYHLYNKPLIKLKRKRSPIKIEPVF